jgi:hypothetical protein
MDYDQPNPAINREEQSINTIGFGEPITLDEAYKALLQWVTTAIESTGKVFLYACRDNAEIQVVNTTWEELELEDALDLFEEEIEGVLFIGHD